MDEVLPLVTDGGEALADNFLRALALLLVDQSLTGADYVLNTVNGEKKKN